MNAIQLIINEREVILGSDTNIRIEYNSPVFAQEIQGSKTYWFDIPIFSSKPKNIRLCRASSYCRKIQNV
jgi:hypothetical protein